MQPRREQSCSEFATRGKKRMSIHDAIVQLLLILIPLAILALINNFRGDVRDRDSA
jgi:uncharacterized integral membrane protein